ncbi:AzlD domain-containing protein [Staphylococcus schleiferi subsp. coagulans]|uniref:AzlD domain-containing protein n=1 Tax=Staphylococcus coagulans TaxID=74706 RepID=UPI0015FBEB2A|nr:AzlD domain-containing protein [Staphylococcus coagulans]MBA8759924.1 AzlD domain-containing protein [Staphylococcus coagulans]MBA8768637.1 AzlD domain-containing protein [Staphylococcus coagulans]
MTLYILLSIIGSGIVTLLLRITPLLMISRVQLSDKVLKWLTFIPITLFTALVMDGLIQQHKGVMGYTLNWNFALALIPTVISAFWLRSLTITVIVGMISVALLRIAGLF